MGVAIKTVNEAIEELIPELKDISEGTKNDIRINIDSRLNERMLRR